MSGFKASLYIGGDASGAKKALAETTSAMAGARKAADTLDKSTAGLERSTKSAANANTALARGEQEVQQAVTQANTAIQQRIERMAGYSRATASARGSAAAFGGTLDQNKASFDAMRMAIDPVYRASKQYEAITDETRRAVAAGAVTQAEANRVLALAEAQYLATGQSAATMARGTGVASGQLGNLTAQFNDIGVMMAAGQNPLTLALQQGTQISQVIGPMGAAGAVKALGGAFLGMLNPVSLITIGSIAAGAAMVQWLSGAGGEAKTLDDRIDDLKNAVDAYASSAENARTPTDELAIGFGSAAVAAREYYENQQKLERASAVDRMRESVAALASEMQILTDKQRANLNSDLLGNQFPEMERLRAEYKLTKDEAFALDAAVSNLANASGPQEAIDAAASLSTLLFDLYGDADKIPGQFRALSEQVKALVETSGQLVAVEDQLHAGRRAVEPEFERQIAWNEKIAQQKSEELELQRRINLAYANSRQASDIAVSQGQALLDQLTQQADIQALVARYGENSRQVAEARIAAEREVFEQTSLTADMSQTMKDEIMAAWDAANGLSLVDIAAGISPAVAQAAALAQNLGIALNEALSLQNMQAGAVYSGRGDGMAEVRARRGETSKTDGRFVYSGPRLDVNNNPILKKTRSSGGARKTAASKLKKEREAVTDLISGLQDELAILRESDPVQQEMLLHREALAGATKSERDKISELIATRNSEKTSLEEQKAAWEDYRSLAFNTFEDLRRSGGDLGSVFDTLTGKIADMATQALLLGEGPLAKFFGTANGGGLIDLALGAFMPNLKPAQALAEGGMVYGRGSGTSDQVPLWGSSGEFMVNARATAKNRTLLEMINAGADIPGFATGGMIGGAANSGSAPAQPVIYFENHSSARIERTEQGYEGKAGRGTKYVLADAVGDAMTQPGGGANRTLKNTFGVGKKRALR
ncbi:phage tail length tape measure family protein [uncultured Sulfitobacter sp.]|uniref:phage tail length tape measure family protein n=1 Tax=uncultured Sulfitobacter sp. TaxID=191468 RepID=UPI0030DB927C